MHMSLATQRDVLEALARGSSHSKTSGSCQMKRKHTDVSNKNEIYWLYLRTNCRTFWKQPCDRRPYEVKLRRFGPRIRKFRIAVKY